MPGWSSGENVEPERIGVIIGGVGGMATLEKPGAGPGRARPGGCQSLSADRNPAEHAGRPGRDPLRHPRLHLVGRYGVRIRRAGDRGRRTAHPVAARRDVVICGASEAPLFPTFAETFANARALARGWDDPTEASRPFDLRSATVSCSSEGAGAAGPRECRRTPTARGASGYADVAGYGVNSDAHHPTAPRPDGTGAAACMRQAFANGKVSTRAGRLRQRARYEHQARRCRRVGRDRPCLRRPRPGGQLHQGADRTHARYVRGRRGRRDRAGDQHGPAAADVQPGRSRPGLPAGSRPQGARARRARSTRCRTRSGSAARTSACSLGTAEHADAATATSEGKAGDGDLRDRPRRDVRGRRPAGGVLPGARLRPAGRTARAGRRPGWPDQRSLLLREGDVQIVLTSGLAAEPPGRRVRPAARRRRRGGRPWRSTTPPAAYAELLRRGAEPVPSRRDVHRRAGDRPW